MKYSDLRIAPSDLDYIESLEKTFPDIDIGDTRVTLHHNGLLANDIIYHFMHQAVQNSELSEDSKNELENSIYINCLDSRFDTNASKFPKKERKEVQSIIESF